MTSSSRPPTGSRSPSDPDRSDASRSVQDTKDAALDVAGNSKQAATEVAQTGVQATREVAQEAKDRASDLLGRTRGQLDEQAESQRVSTVETLRSLGDQLASMTDNTDQHGTAVDLASRARDRAREAADWVDQRDPQQILDELRQVGRNRPGAFLLGAFAAGLAAGRLTRGAVEVHTGDDDGVGPTAARSTARDGDDAYARPRPGTSPQSAL